MKEDIILTIVLAILGSSALGSFAQFLISRHDKKKDEHKANQYIEASKKFIDDKLNPIYCELKELKLDTTRLRLTNTIHQNPKNHDTIMRIAYKYFITLGGDEEMFDIYRKWQLKEGISTEWFDAVIKKEEKGVK